MISMAQELSKQDVAVTGDILHAISQFPLFASLGKDEVEKISPFFYKKLHPASKVIISHGDESKEVYFIVSGAVRATLFTPSGREISYQDLGCGEIFGELSAIDGKPRSTHVIALDDTETLVIGKKDFNNMILEYPHVGVATMQKMAGMIRFLCDRVYQFGAMDVNCRVRTELVRLAKTQGSDDREPVKITNVPRHQDLANRLATHREAVTRELNRLEKNGIIKKENKNLIILDMKKLKTLVLEG